MRENRDENASSVISTSRNLHHESFPFISTLALSQKSVLQVLNS